MCVCWGGIEAVQHHARAPNRVAASQPVPATQAGAHLEMVGPPGALRAGRDDAVLAWGVCRGGPRALGLTQRAAACCPACPCKGPGLSNSGWTNGLTTQV